MALTRLTSRTLLAKPIQLRPQLRRGRGVDGERQQQAERRGGQQRQRVVPAGLAGAARGWGSRAGRRRSPGARRRPAPRRRSRRTRSPARAGSRRAATGTAPARVSAQRLMREISRSPGAGSLLDPNQDGIGRPRRPPGARVTPENQLRELYHAATLTAPRPPAPRRRPRSPRRAAAGRPDRSAAGRSRRPADRRCGRSRSPRRPRCGRPCRRSGRPDDAGQGRDERRR